MSPPVVPGRIHGLREWFTDERPGPPELRASVHHDIAWPRHGEAFEADCLEYPHPAPQSRCSCGIYAWHPAQDSAECVFPPHRWNGSVAGIIEAWGEVEVHADGFRAQCARPRWLVLPARADAVTRSRVSALAREYDAEILTLRGARDLSVYCRDHDLGLAPGALRDLFGDAPLPAPGRLERLRGSSAVDRVARAVGTGVGLLGAALLYAFGALMWLGMAVGILGTLWAVGAGLFGGSGGARSPSPRSPPSRALPLAQQGVLPVTDGALYVALVRNTSRTRTALDVTPLGEFRNGSGARIGEPDAFDDVWATPSIPPGRTAVVVDWLDGEPGLARHTRRFAIRMHADSGFRRMAAPPASITRVRADRRRCVVLGTVRSRRRLREVDLMLVARGRRGRIVWVHPGVAGPLPRGRARQIVARIPPAGCARATRAVEGYPWWSPEALAGLRRAQRGGVR